LTLIIYDDIFLIKGRVMVDDFWLSESLEDYLEVILELEEESKVARAKDIAEKLGVQRGSVTGALKTLEEKALINYQPYSFITLTQKGRIIANGVSNRHLIIKDFLSRVLQFDEVSAQTAACKIEHAIDDNGIKRFVEFLSFFDSCPRCGVEWVDKFISICSKNKPDIIECKNCINSQTAPHASKKF
jgi:DtxR family Mn-dependent transcriptional regulator